MCPDFNLKFGGKGVNMDFCINEFGKIQIYPLFSKLGTVSPNFLLASLKKSLEEVIAGSRGFLRVVKEQKGRPG